MLKSKITTEEKEGNVSPDSYVSDGIGFQLVLVAKIS